MRAFVETMPAVPWTEVVDPETGHGRYRFIDPQVEEVFGYTPGELLSSPTTSSDSCTRTIASGRWRRATGATAPASRGISSTG